jgi:predicted nucleic acid-binding protein
VSENNYNDSFKLDTTAIRGIKNQLEDFKTIAHKIDGPRNNSDIAAIMLYLKLQAYITTTKKVNAI